MLALTSSSDDAAEATCTFGPFSWIHLLTLVTLVTLPFAVLAAAKG